MSFSADVKKELARRIAKKDHCQVAELAAMLSLQGRVRITPQAAGESAGEAAYGVTLDFESDNENLIGKYFTLRAKTISIYSDVKALSGGDAKALLGRIKKWDEVMKAASEGVEDASFCLSKIEESLTAQTCCKRAYIRGAFLAAGSLSDPHKGYHLEIVCHSADQAAELESMIACFDITAHTVLRKNHYVVYIKESSQIVDLLNVMEAHVSLMNLENVRIEKQMRNSVNRKVNCETANLGKTVTASVRQREDILFIQEKIGLSSLPESLAEMAAARLAYPDMNLKDLGESLHSPVGKSGVNHRLRKIHEIAEKLRD